MKTTSRPARALTFLVAIAAVASGSLPARAERPRVYAISGATLIPAAGQRIEGGTVVIRDGLIESVSVEADVPPDAEVIAGEGLWIYPGLIEPLSGLGLESDRTAEPSGEAGSPFGRVRPEAPAGPAHPLSRVHPERRARDRLRSFAGDRAREAERYRELGYTAALVAPDSGTFRGSSAVILLLDDAPVPEMILRDEVADHIAFEGGRFGGDYPTSLMGAAATIRQALLDAARHRQWQERYARPPRGMTRPDHVAAYEALTPLLSGNRPAVFHVDDPEDLLLAHRLASEFGLKAIFAGSGRAAEIAEAVRETGRPLILPLAFPDRPELDDEDEALDVSLRALRRYVDAPAAARRLHEAGVRFAFTTHGLGNMADARRNLRRILDAGLPEDTALAALTTVPASLLGIDAVAGTLEAGKIANLVAFDGPLFAEDTKVKRVFVDGVDHPVREKKKPEGDPNAVVDPRGEWSVVFEFGTRSMQRTWTITGTKGQYEGTAETQRGTVAFDRVELEGNMLTVVFPDRGGRGAMELTVIVREETFEGTADFGPRSVPVRGTRVSGPGGGGR